MDNANARWSMSSGDPGPTAGVRVVERVRAEFLEMPCLRLTSQQAQRLFGLTHSQCDEIFDELEARGFLRRVNGSYRRADW